ncbi:hypothetical protein CCY99_00730 [Helicobacter sp. 16-1353]|uniref:hypothetical protein n=1 Tax=Helicobacter sp. 16-1353 TaxID=2004996 RepID=UPI000DCD6865|nr:hypothetical protein [Helicobacter sp. 16-1353]RAX55257.1 hypothetical protein CCY99_00730 [Helicobacter sp. 16-1353]
MKINIVCESVILQKTLDSYLKDYISNYEDCDFIIADCIDESFNKPICLVTFGEDSDIRRPIHRESLFNDLEKFNKSISEIPRINVEKFNNILDMNELENLKKSLDSINNLQDDLKDNTNQDALKNEIENIIRDFTDRLYNAIKKNNQ